MLKTYCNLETETIAGYEVSAQMKEVWNVELNLLVEFMRVCHKHNLKFFLNGGTLLGAVRHKGFIPWDDDIDIDMLREDYDKLLAIAPTEFAHPYFFQSPYTDPGYYRGHSQLRHSDSTAILPVELRKGCKFNQGIFIDIFVLDSLPEPQVWREEVEYRNTILSYLWKRHYKLNRINLFAYTKLCLKMGKDRRLDDLALYRKFEDSLRKTKISDSDYVGPTSFLNNDTTYRNKEWFSEQIWVDFESIKVPIPNGYHQLLTKLYGDYMTPCKSPSYHGTVMFDTKRSYREYIAENKPNSLLKEILTCIGASK